MRRRRWGRKSALSPGRRSRTWQSWHRRVDFHNGQVRAATTPEAQLAACFDHFRAAAIHGGEGAAVDMTGYLIDRAAVLQDMLGCPGLHERGVQGIKDARGHLGRLRAAFSWYRAALAAARREYGDDGEFRELLRWEMHEVATYLHGEAVALERAAEPA